MGNTYIPPPFSLFTLMLSLFGFQPPPIKRGGKKSCPQGESHHSNHLHQSNPLKRFQKLLVVPYFVLTAKPEGFCVAAERRGSEDKRQGDETPKRRRCTAADPRGDTAPSRAPEADKV